MIRYIIDIEMRGLHKKDNLNHIIRSIIENNRYRGDDVIINKKSQNYSSKNSVSATIEIVDFRVFDQDAESIDIRFDRYPYPTNTDLSVQMKIEFIDTTSDQHYAATECIDLYNRLDKRQKALIADKHNIYISKSINSKKNWVMINCIGTQLTIPLIYI